MIWCEFDAKTCICEPRNIPIYTNNQQCRSFTSYFPHWWATKISPSMSKEHGTIKWKEGIYSNKKITTSLIHTVRNLSLIIMAKPYSIQKYSFIIFILHEGDIIFVLVLFYTEAYAKNRTDIYVCHNHNSYLKFYTV